MTSRIIRVKGNGGSRVFEAHSPHSPLPVVFTADVVYVGPDTFQVLARVGENVVGIFPSDWAVVEVASRVEGKEDPLSSEFQFGQVSGSDFDTNGNYDVAPGD